MQHPIASGGHSPPRPPASEIHLCVQTPPSENPGSAPATAGVSYLSSWFERSSNCVQGQLNAVNNIPVATNNIPVAILATKLTVAVVSISQSRKSSNRSSKCYSIFVKEQTCFQMPLQLNGTDC